MDVYDQIWLWGINDVVSKMSSNIVLWKWQLLDGFRYVNNDDRGCHIRERLFCLHNIYIIMPLGFYLVDENSDVNSDVNYVE